MAREISFSINSLIAACNKGDRFKLLEDGDVLPSNLDNGIHKIFDDLNFDSSMKQALQLASQFLAHDSVLTFFVPLLYGKEQKLASRSRDHKTYLSDPLVTANDAERKAYINGVRQALHCLAHRISFEFAQPGKGVHARSIMDEMQTTRTAKCHPAFQKSHITKVIMSDRVLEYYRHGYSTASRCAQFRHDFLFTITLIHELVHCVGASMRGNFQEPFIREDWPDNEWGFGWEFWFFGMIVDPLKRTQLGTHLLMRKIWANSTMLDQLGGKEYSDLPMSWIAQWFRRETWSRIAQRGPTAISAPQSHFKIQISKTLGGYVVSSDCPDIRKDLVTPRSRWEEASLKSGNVDLSESGKRVFIKIFWLPKTREQMQQAEIAVPSRSPEFKHARLSQPSSSTPPETSRIEPEEEVISNKIGSMNDSQTDSCNVIRLVRKRRGAYPESDSSEQIEKIAKRRSKDA